MNRLKAWVRAFFGLSRRETNAFLILLPLMAVSLFVVPLYHSWQAQQPQDFSKEQKTLDSLLAQWKWPEKSKELSENKVERFPFDPNTATVNELQALGFPEFLANRIHNYRTKKGKFVVKNDLLKIYGMDSTLFDDLRPFIALPDVLEKKESRATLTPGPNLTSHTEKFDLNLADTTQLIRIYGIGSKLSVRIIRYRTQLGGFTSPNQLHEVYGLDSTVVHELQNSSFIAHDFKPRQIDLNRASEKELAAHPYIRYNLAKAITTYRFQHGDFQSVEDLTKIALVDEAFFTRIKPYLTVNP